ncbi:MAG TPA: DUF4383 domain-containing protein [Longimicrobiaceae bacterium]|nr:DUF4383 domain-containing protein [Longimicrobiaceae bacterium]
MKTLSQRVALIFGVVFVLVAVLGFITPGGTSMDATGGMLLGMFPVNLLHNVVHLLFGVWGVLASRTWPAARTYCRIGGIIYLVLTVLGFVAPTTFGLIPIGGNDIWLHALLGIVLAGVGFTDKGPANS